METAVLRHRHGPSFLLVVAAAFRLNHVHALGWDVLVGAGLELALLLIVGGRWLIAVVAVDPLLNGLAPSLVLLKAMSQALWEVGLAVVVVGAPTLAVVGHALVALRILGAAVEDHLAAQLGTDSIEF